MFLNVLSVIKYQYTYTDWWIFYENKRNHTIAISNFNFNQVLFFYHIGSINLIRIAIFFFCTIIVRE
jgi:hypothetical protein